MNARVSWHDLPNALRLQIQDQTGSFIAEDHVTTGFNCLVGMVLQAGRGKFFLKGVAADHACAVWTQANEAAINKHIQPFTAELAFHIQTENWDILGFQYLANHRHADLSPGSPDLPKVAATLQALSALPPPDDMQLRTIGDRFRDYGDDLYLVAGSSVAHTDPNRHNFLIGGTAKLVDWAWPTLAAAWVDTACVGLHLIVAGHCPEAVERWCATCPAYAAASAEAISTFVLAQRNLWHEISAAAPEPWKLKITAATDRWVSHRGLRPLPSRTGTAWK
jgi:hypothetical protein